MKTNLYQILGVRKNATPGAIKQAYRRKCSEHHPDREQGDADKMLAVREAYDVLKNPDRRAKYDATGETKQSTPLDAIAMQMLASAFASFVQQGDDYLDPIPTIRKAFNDRLVQEQQNLKKLDKQLAHIYKRAKQIQKQDASDNIYAGIVEQLTSQTKASIAACEQVIQAIPIGLKILDEYTGKPAEERKQHLFSGTESPWTDRYYFNT